MRQNRCFSTIGLSVLCLFGAVAQMPNAYAASAPSKPGLKEVVISPIINYVNVRGDRGRFRQDWRMPNGFSSGFENVEAVTTDDKVRFQGYGISENDYGHEMEIALPSDSRLKIKGKYFRQYYDGSNEPWDPSRYFLTSEFADWEDDNLYADRLSETLEYHHQVDEDAGWAVGYDLWGRFGRERLLRGEQTTAAGEKARRSLPARAYLEGLSHTFYGEYQRILGKKYNLKARPSFEFYHDYQDIQFYRYAAGNGSLSQSRTWFDQPNFKDLNLQASIDSFLNEDVYIFSGYLFNYLQNGSVRSEVRAQPPSVAPTFTNPEIDNERVSNTANLGTVIMDFLKVKDLRFRASSRAEVADTNTRGRGVTGSATSGNFGGKDFRSDIGEYWVSESLGLTYTGKPNAIVDWGIDFDQRKLDYDQFFDAGSYESFVDFGARTRFFSYNADILYNDLKNTVRGSYRFNRHLKSGLQYRLRYHDQDYDINTDTEPVFYPGVIKNIRREAHEATASFDVWWVESWSSTFKYQFISDNIHTQLAGLNTQDADRHRVTATLLGKPCNRLTLFGSATYESNLIDTPTVGVATNSTWFQGTDPFDFRGDYFIYSLNANWAVSDDTKLDLRFQQTNSMGSIRHIQRNELYEISLGVSRKIDADTQIKASYFYFDFNDKNEVVPGFDNYDGQGVICSFLKKL